MGTDQRDHAEAHPRCRRRRFNVFGNLAGIVVPIAIRYLVGDSGSFAPALILIAAISVGGAPSFLTLVDKVERLPG
ncbi:hypothetical protein [Streptomyces sp. NPDC055134]